MEHVPHERLYCPISIIVDSFSSTDFFDHYSVYGRLHIVSRKEHARACGRVQVENVNFLPALESFFQSVTVQSSSCEELVDHQNAFAVS